MVVSRLKIYFNMLSLVACENENKGCLFNLFVHIAPIVRMFGWFLYLRTTLRIGLETFSNKESLRGLYSGILQCLKRKSSVILQFCNLQKLFHHFQLARFAPLKLSCPKEKISLFSKKFLSQTSFSFELL